jgi:serine/threonine protein kinase
MTKMHPHATGDVQLTSGDVVDGKYEIIAKIGHGRMGVVYRAHSLSLKRDAAIKMLTYVSPETLDGFVRTAATMGQVKHRAVVRIDDFGTTDRWGPYLAMAYVPGADLATYASTQRVSVQQAVDLTLAICSGVSACHQQSVVHGDLKPGNVRVAEQGEWQDRVKILGFGLGLPARAGAGNAAAATADVRYLAPELLRTGNASKQSDQYAIASLLYLLLAGRGPFDGFDDEKLMRAKLQGEYPALRTIQPSSSATLQAAVERGLALDPLCRFPSIDDFARAILSEASPAPRNFWTRHHANSTLPIDRRLVEPVSARRPLSRDEGAGPPAKLAFSTVMAVPSSAATAVPADAPPQRPSPSQGRPTGPAFASPESRRIDLRMMIAFVCGAVLGAALATGALISFLMYQRHETSLAPAVQLMPEGRRLPQTP